MNLTLELLMIRFLRDQDPDYLEVGLDWLDEQGLLHTEETLCLLNLFYCWAGEVQVFPKQCSGIRNVLKRFPLLYVTDLSGSIRTPIFFTDKNEILAYLAPLPQEEVSLAYVRVYEYGTYTYYFYYDEAEETLTSHSRV